MVNIKYLISFFILFISPLSLAYVSIKTNKTNIEIGEQIVLEVSTDENIEIKPTQLNQIFQHFDNLKSSFASSLSYINNEIKQKKTWSYTLSPNQKGLIKIPAISFGKSKSSSFIINVKESTVLNQNNSSSPDFLLLGEVDSKKPYVQSEIIYSFKLLTRKQILSGRINHLNIPGINVKTISKEKRFSMNYKGKKYNAYEWKYAFIPQRSGQINIPKLSFSGVIQTNKGQRSIKLFTNTIALQVRPQPALWPKNYEWLPAKNISIWEIWQPSETQWQVGNRYTRNIEINAKGIEASQISNLKKLPSFNEVSIYPNQPSRKSTLGPQGHEGEYSLSTDFLPKKEGKIVLPEITIPWWDIEEDKLKFATLAEKEVLITLNENQISAVSNLENTSTNEVKKLELLNTLVNPESDKNLPILSSTDTKEVSPNYLFLVTKQNIVWFISFWLLSSLFFIWLANYLLIFFENKHKIKQPKKTIDPIFTSLNQLKNIIKNNNANQLKECYTLLLFFHREHVNQLNHELNRQWREIIKTSSQTIYNTSLEALDSVTQTKLQHLIKVTEKSLKKNKTILPSLYLNP